MLFNVQNGSTVYTHRTGSQSITNVDEYLRALTPHGTSGYGSIYYANANGVSYSQHNNRYYVKLECKLTGPRPGHRGARPSLDGVHSRSAAWIFRRLLNRHSFCCIRGLHGQQDSDSACPTQSLPTRQTALTR